MTTLASCGNIEVTYEPDEHLSWIHALVNTGWDSESYAFLSIEADGSQITSAKRLEE